jgi:hypothetical protein
MKKSAELLFILLWLNGEREEKKKNRLFYPQSTGNLILGI